MTKAKDTAMGKPAPLDDAVVVQPVREDKGSPVRERRKDGNVCLEARIEDEGGLGAL